MLLRLLETWWDTPAVVIPLLRLWSELSLNKNSRVAFPTSSADGILLFKHVCQVVSTLGERLLRTPAPEDSMRLYKERLKPTALLLQMMGRAMSGGYCIFGVFAMYNDQTFSKTLGLLLQLAHSVPLGTAMNYPKFNKSYFEFLEVLFKEHTELVVAAEPALFRTLLSAMHEGLQSKHTNVSSNCASSLEQLLSFHGEQLASKQPSECAGRLKYVARTFALTLSLHAIVDSSRPPTTAESTWSSIPS